MAVSCKFLSFGIALNVCQMVSVNALQLRVESPKSDAKKYKFCHNDNGDFRVYDHKDPTRLLKMKINEDIFDIEKIMEESDEKTVDLKSMDADSLQTWTMPNASEYRFQQNGKQYILYAYTPRASDGGKTVDEVNYKVVLADSAYLFGLEIDSEKPWHPTAGSMIEFGDEASLLSATVVDLDDAQLNVALGVQTKADSKNSNLPPKLQDSFLRSIEAKKTAGNVETTAEKEDSHIVKAWDFSSDKVADGYNWAVGNPGNAVLLVVIILICVIILGGLFSQLKQGCNRKSPYNNI